MAASAAATVRMKNTNTCPDTSFRKYENATKLIFADNSISSIHINNTTTFFLLRNMPAILIENSIAPKVR
jgi:hypothetical protein